MKINWTGDMFAGRRRYELVETTDDELVALARCLIERGAEFTLEPYHATIWELTAKREHEDAIVAQVEGGS